MTKKRKFTGLIRGAILSSAIVITAPAAATGILLDDGLLTQTFSSSPLLLSPLGNAMGIAWDGTSYWAASGGSTSGIRLVQHDAMGTVVNSYGLGIDFRSIFTDGSGNIHGSDFGGNGIQVYALPSPPSSTLKYTLDTTPNSNMEIAYRPSDGKLYGHSQGVIYQYNFTTGVQEDSFSLIDFSGSFAGFYQIAIAEDWILTFENTTDLGLISAWDFTGKLIGQSKIDTDTNIGYSFSYANGLAWIEKGGQWQGYDIFGAPVPVPGTIALFGLGWACLGAWRRQRITTPNRNALSMSSGLSLPLVLPNATCSNRTS